MAGPKRSASSASTYAASHLSLSLLALLSSAGFSKSSSTAVHLLTELLQRYIQLIGTTCVQHANLSGRNVIVPHDLAAALEHIMGADPVQEVLQWAKDEARLTFGAERDLDAHGRTAQPNRSSTTADGASALPPSRYDSGDSLYDPQRAKDLRKRLSVGRHQPVPDSAAELHYLPISLDDYDTLAAQSYKSERRIEKLVWHDTGSQKGQRVTRVSVKAGKRKTFESDDMDVDSHVGVGTNGRPPSRSASTTASEELEDDNENGLSSSSDAESSPGHGHLDICGRPGTSPRRQRNGVTPARLQSRSPSRRGTRRPSPDGHPQSVYEDVLRSFGPLKIDYVPSYLPIFPPTGSWSESPSRDARNGASWPSALPDVAVAVKAEAAAQGSEARHSPQPQDTDLEHIEQERQRVEAAQRAALAATDAAAAARTAEGEAEAAKVSKEAQSEPTVEQRAAEAEKALEAMQTRRVLRDCWKEAIPYKTSTVGTAYPKAELGDLDEMVTEMLSHQDDLVSIAPPTSSLRAFAADFKALVDDPSTSGAAGIYLTPQGAAHQDAASKRRRLASGIADPARYVPNDSLYGAVGARPVMLPFQPGPSWLVSTLPPPTLYEDNAVVANALAAPILTPVIPQGRPSALVPPSGSLVPPLAYRHPAALSMSARLVSNNELLKRVSRFEDPPPLLDDKHAERFYHGLPASRDLVGGSSSSTDLSSNISKSRNGGGGSGSGNTTLHAALEKLVLQLKEKEAVVLPEEDKEELQRRQQELQLQMQAAESAGDAAADGRGKEGVAGMVGDSYASRIRNGNITMVHTWDWVVKDPFDPALPGRRVRGESEKSSSLTATAPVAIERERGKKRRERRESSANDLVGGLGGTDWSVDGTSDTHG